MPDRAETMLLVYQHAIQLTLIDHPVEDAVRIAWALAALAFDENAHDAGMAAARQSRLVLEPAASS